MRPISFPQPVRSVFGPGFTAGGGGGGGSVTITNQITEITASGLSEDPGQVLVEGTDGGALLLGADIRAALDATLGDTGWREPEAERLLSYDAAARRIDILGGTGAVLPLATASGAGLMSAADKLALAAAGGTASELTRAGLAAATVDPGIASLRTSGYAAAGDGGGGLHVRVATEPAHAGKVQSADGAWWELAAEDGEVSVLQFGAVRELGNVAPTVDAHAAFAAALGFAALFANPATGEVAGLRVRVPHGKYLLAQPLEIRTLASLEGQKGTGLFDRWPVQLHFAGCAGIVVHDTRTTLAEGVYEDPDLPATPRGAGACLSGLMLLGGAAADSGFDLARPGLRLHARALVEHCHIRDFAGHGVHVEADLDSNANTFDLRNLTCEMNGGSGIFVQGLNANSGRVIGADLSLNGRWGIEDRSFLGNFYFGIHTQANGTAATGRDTATAVVHRADGGTDRWYSAAAGASLAALAATEPGTDAAVWIPTHEKPADALAPGWAPGQPEGTYVHGGAVLLAGATNESLVSGCYNEENQGLVQLDQRAMVAGGIMGPAAGAGFVQGGNTVHRGKLVFPTDAAAGLPAEFRVHDGPEHMFNIVPEGTPQGFQLATIGYIAGGVIGFENASAGTQSQLFTLATTTATLGRTGAVGLGHTVFPRGAFHGDTAQGRQFLFHDDADTGRDHGAGDLVLSSDPAAGTWGWQYLGAHEAAGTPGTVRALWRVPTLDGAVTLPGYDAAARASAGAAGHAGTLVWAPDRGAPAVSDGAAWRDLRAMPVAEKAGDATLAAAEAFALLRFTGAAPAVLTVEAGTLAPGEQASLMQAGTGAVTVAAGAGVTLEHEADAVPTLRGQFAVASLVCVAPDTYLLVGGLAAA